MGLKLNPLYDATRYRVNTQVTLRLVKNKLANSGVNVIKTLGSLFITLDYILKIF
jgi:hypothetical protein